MRLFRPALALTLAALAAGPAWAQLQGVGYRLAPGVSYVLFEDNAGLTETPLIGAEAGLAFGEFLELNGSYLFGTSETDFGALSGADSTTLQRLTTVDGRDVSVQRYGGEIKLNLGTGTLVPFLVGGTGLIRLGPDGRDATRSIYLVGGAGVQISVADRYAVSLSAVDLTYRYNAGSTFFDPADLAAVGLGYDDFNQTTVHNPTIRAAAQLYLGGRRPGQISELDRELRRQFGGGLSGLSLVVEPFYGRVEFDDAFAYRDQTFVGVETGVDLGPLVGVRAFYGRGVEGDAPLNFEDVQMVGGTLRLRLSEGGGFVPFLSVGGGYLDVLSGYATDDGAEPANAAAEDRPFAVAGVGAVAFLGRRLRLIGEARGLVMSTQEGDDLSQPEEVYLNPLFRAGVALGVGGRAGAPRVVRQSDLDAERAAFEAERAAFEAERAAERDRLAAELAEAREAAALREADLLAEIERVRDGGDEETAEALEDLLEVARVDAALDVAEAEARVAAIAPADSTLARPALAERAPVVDAPAARVVETAPGERTITIPIPEQGELYIRYGEPGGVQIGEFADVPPQEAPALVARETAADTARAGLSEAEVRAAIREALREALADQDAAALTDADAAALERRIEDRIADRIGGSLRSDDGVSAAEVARIERRLEDRMDDQLRQIRALLLRQSRQQGSETIVVDTPGPTGFAPVAGDSTAVARPRTTVVTTGRPAFYGSAFTFSPTVGTHFGRGPETFVVGARAEYATGPSLRYLPELLVGVTGDRFFSGSLDLAYGVPFAPYGSPYVRGGVGLVNYAAEADDTRTTLMFNVGLGADLRYGVGRFFVDFTTGNLGRFNRLTGGYRFPFGRAVY